MAKKKEDKEKTTKKKTSSKAKKSSTKKTSKSKATSKSKEQEVEKVADSNPKRTYKPKGDVSKYDEENPAPRDPKVRYSDKELEEFREIIQDAKDEALDELSMLKDRLEDLNEFDYAEESMIYSMHMGDQGSEAQEKEKTYAQIQRINEYLKKLDDSLIRIDQKTYGICRVCGILIAKERLRAVPITTLSASYKIRKECPEDGVDRIEARKD